MPIGLIRIAWAATLLIAAALCLPGATQAQQGLAPIPALTGRVVDATNTLDAAQERALSQKLAAIEAAKGSQVVFLLVPSTQPQDIASYANRVGNAWKIGRKEVGDGLLLVVAKEDRKVRIEVAKALEGAVPDLAAKRVIDEAVTPAFRRGDYFGGLNAAADQLGARIRGEPLPAPAPAPERTARADGDSGFDIWELGILAFFAVPVLAAWLRRVIGRKVAAVVISTGVGALAMFATASLLVAAVVAFVALLVALFGSGWRGGQRGGWGYAGGWSSGSGDDGGWSSGSDSSSDFSSGGGGDFGGGGASGDW